MVKAFGLQRHFDGVVGMSRGLSPKPSPDILLRASELLAVDPRRGVMVGDTPLDIAAGKAAGMATVGVTWGFSTRDALVDALPDHLVDDPAALSLALEEMFTGL
jgi:phosphoglycolate phosphatase-like HAD superfamily hydrolase